MIKAIFFDIDGTLVSFRTHRVPDSTVESLAALRRAGVKTFIATGRQLGSINNLGTLTFDGYVTLNGGYCIAGRDHVIYKRSIPQTDIDALLDYLEHEEPFPCAFVLENGIYLNYKSEKVEKLFRLINFPEPPIRPLSAVRGHTVYQLIAFLTPEQEERLLPVIPGCTATRWNPLFTDIVPKGSNKGIGIDKIIDYFGIPLADTMAFGDGGNDIEMLRHVALGVAMGNAGEEVKAAARYVTTSVDDNGISNALRHFGIL